MQIVEILAYARDPPWVSTIVDFQIKPPVFETIELYHSSMFWPHMPRIIRFWGEWLPRKLTPKSPGVHWAIQELTVGATWNLIMKYIQVCWKRNSVYSSGCDWRGHLVLLEFCGKFWIDSCRNGRDGKKMENLQKWRFLSGHLFCLRSSDIHYLPYQGLFRVSRRNGVFFFELLQRDYWALICTVSLINYASHGSDVFGSALSSVHLKSRNFRKRIQLSTEINNRLRWARLGLASKFWDAIQFAIPVDSD